MLNPDPTDAELHKHEQEAAYYDDSFTLRLIKALRACRQKRKDLLETLELISQLQRDKCEIASAETLLMLLNHKVDLALAALGKEVSDGND